MAIPESPATAANATDGYMHLNISKGSVGCLIVVLRGTAVPRRVSVGGFGACRGVGWLPMHAVVCCSLVVYHLKFHNTVRGIIWYDLVWVYAWVSYSFMMFDRRSTPLVWGSYSWAYWECIERESANVTWCGTGRGTRTHTWDWFSSAFSALARPKRGQRPTSALRRKRVRERESHTTHTPTHLHRLFYISGHENWDSSEPAGWEFPEIGSGRPRSGFALPDAQEDVRFL